MPNIYRNLEIDILRGICVISIIMIHTTFWSGGAYVPWPVQSLSLLIDVPAFFFIAGASIAYTQKIQPIKVIYKMIFYFGVTLLIYDIIQSIITHTINFDATLSALGLYNLKTPLLPVFGGSYWFVPVFCAVSILAAIILEYFPKAIAGFILGGLILYVLGYFMNFPVGGKFLHTSLNFCIFYTSLYLLGYLFIQKQYFCNYQFALSLIVVGFLGFILTYFLKGGNQVFILQSSKFPVSLPYVLASLFGIGLLLITWNLWKKFSSINGGGYHQIPYICWTKCNLFLYRAGYFLKFFTQNCPKDSDFLDTKTRFMLLY
ncbi:acyltransferase family protein [Helicobacter equorum]|uniref:acyltransferase family protein n=1 Tax=Helicobacter equorum TaxID=361872 RepID=UPI00360732DC